MSTIFETVEADFERVFESLVFGPSTPTEQCRNISIFLDSVLEDVQIFDVTATIGGNGIQGSPATIAITSSDSEWLTALCMF